MPSFRRIVVILLLAGLFIAGGLVLPKALAHFGFDLGVNLGLGKSTDAALETDSLAALTSDSTGDSWDRNLFHPLNRVLHLPPKAVKRRAGKAQVTFPKGLPLHEYAYTFEQICDRNGIVRLNAEERRGLAGSGNNAIYLLALHSDTLKVVASLGQEAMAGSARLALVLTGLDSITLADAALIQSFEFACNVAIDPFNPNPALQALKAGLGRVTVLLDLPMEPMAYPYINPGKHALYLHFNDADVKRLLDEGLGLLPNAQGIVTRYGDRAIENRPLLKRLYAYLTPRRLPLLDLTGSPRSLAREVAGENGALSQRAHLLTDSLEVEMDFARKVSQAVKSGEAVMALQYSRMAFQKLSRSLADRESEFESMGLALVPLSRLGLRPKNEASDSSSASSRMGASSPIKTDAAKQGARAASDKKQKGKPVKGKPGQAPQKKKSSAKNYS